MPWEKQFREEDACDRIMQAFWARGYQATSMQDLVDATGVNRGSLYATFGNKRSIFLTVLRLYDDRMRRKLLSELEGRCSPREAIRRLFDGIVAQAAVEKENRGCFLTNTALELAAHDPEVGRIVADAQEDMEAFFARMIVNGQAIGEVPASVEPTSTARGLLSSLLGLRVLSRSRPERALLQAIADDAMRRLL